MKHGLYGIIIEKDYRFEINMYQISNCEMWISHIDTLTI